MEKLLLALAPSTVSCYKIKNNFTRILSCFLSLDHTSQCKSCSSIYSLVIYGSVSSKPCCMLYLRVAYCFAQTAQMKELAISAIGATGNLYS